MATLRAYVATNIMGSFAFNEKGDIIDKKLFPKEPEKIAQRLALIKTGEIVEEERKILDNLIQCGYKEVIWDTERKYSGIECICKPENIAGQKLQEEFRSIALQLKWVSSQAELNEILTNVNVLLTRTEIQKPRKDEVIMRCVSVLNESEKTANIFSEKMKEWYGLHFPELAAAVKSNEKYAEIVSKYGSRENIKDEELEGLAKKSAGMEFSEDDIKQVQKLAGVVLEMSGLSKSLERYLEKLTKENVPNISAVAGPVLAARLLNLAGGLEHMAKMPSSTIQLLGAEKALFRHLRENAKAPKYGILFSHQLVQNAPADRKGKIARLVAAKLSIASRVDFFSKDDRGEQMRKELEEEVGRALGGAGQECIR